MLLRLSRSNLTPLSVVQLATSPGKTGMSHSMRASSY